MIIYYTKLAILYAGYINAGMAVCFSGIIFSRSQIRKIGRLCIGMIEKLLGLSYEIKGHNFLEADKAYVIVSNHQHAIDVIAMMHVYDKIDNYVVIAKQGLKWMGPFGIALQLLGTIFVRRGCLEESLPDFNYLIETAKENNTSIYMFPEGSRHLSSENGGEMLPFKKGAFHLAIDSGFPILPVVISDYDFINMKEKRFENGRIKIQILKPIETASSTKKDIDELVTTTRNNMISVFDKTRSANVAVVERT